MQAGKHDGDEHNAVQPHGELMAEHAFEPAAHGGERRNQRIEPACHHDECERDNADQRPERDLARCFRRSERRQHVLVVDNERERPGAEHAVQHVDAGQSYDAVEPAGSAAEPHAFKHPYVGVDAGGDGREHRTVHGSERGPWDRRERHGHHDERGGPHQYSLNGESTDCNAFHGHMRRLA